MPHTDLDYITRKELPAMCRVPLRTIDKPRAEGQFPQPDCRLGKHLLWRRSTIGRFLADGGTA